MATSSSWNIGWSAQPPVSPDLTSSSSGDDLAFLERYEDPPLPLITPPPSSSSSSSKNSVSPHSSQATFGEHLPPSTGFHDLVALEKLNQVIRQCLHSVCLVNVPGDCGTGCFIRGGLLLTNAHVIHSREEAKQATILFLKVVSENSLTRSVFCEFADKIELDPDAFWKQSNPPRKIDENRSEQASEGFLDYTLVAIKPHPFIDSIQGYAFSIFQEIEIKQEQDIVIFQHPKVYPKRGLEAYGASYWKDGVIGKVEKCFIHYNAKTSGGSSGGAVVSLDKDENGQHRLVALHYQGNIPCRCLQQIGWCNAGINMNAITAELKDDDLKKIKRRIEEINLRTYNALNTHLMSVYSERKAKVHKIGGDGESLTFNFPIVSAFVRLQFIEYQNSNSDKLFNEERMSVHYYENLEPRDAIDLKHLFRYDQHQVGEPRRIVIFGDAGIGKTTLCEWMACHGKQLWIKENFSVVLLIKLRELGKYSVSHGLYKILAKECGFNLTDHQEVESKEFRDRALLILDGYDELPSGIKGGSSRDFFNILLKEFANVLITSRPMRIGLEKVTQRFKIFGFDKSSIRNYISKFYAGLVEQENFQQLEAKKKIEELSSTLACQPALESLARIPINLGLICSLFFRGQNRIEFQKLNTVTKFYHEIIDEFYRLYLIDRAARGIGSCGAQEHICTLGRPRVHLEIAPVAEALEQIAWEAIKTDSIYIQHEIVEGISSKNELSPTELLRLGIIGLETNEENRFVYFIHLIFQEFFAGAYLARSYLDAQSREGDPKAYQRPRSELAQIKFNPRYRFVLCFAAGYLTRYGSNSIIEVFLKDLFERPHDLAEVDELHLLAQCFLECWHYTTSSSSSTSTMLHSTFIDKCLNYIEKSSHESIVNFLNQYPKLLEHPTILECIRSHLLNQSKAWDMTLVLNSLRIQWNREEFIPLITILVSTLVGPHSDSKYEFLKKISDRGARLSIEIVQSLKEAILSNTDSDDARTIIDIFVNIAEREEGEILCQANAALMEILEHPSLEDYRDTAAYAIGIISKRSQKISLEAVNVLLRLMRNLSDPEDVSIIADDLREITHVPGLVPDDKLITGLEEIFKESSLWKIKRVAIKLLSAYSSKSRGIADRVVDFFLDTLENQKIDERNLINLAAALSCSIKNTSEPVKGIIRLGHIFPVTSYKHGKEKIVERLKLILKSKERKLSDGELRQVNDSVIGECARIVASKAITSQAYANKRMYQQIVTSLLQIAKESIRDTVKQHSVSVIGNIAAQGGSGTDQAIAALLQIVEEGSRFDPFTQAKAAQAIGIFLSRGIKPSVAKKVKAILLETIQSRRDKHAVISAAEALFYLANQDDGVSKQVLNTLLEILKSSLSEDKDIRMRIVDVLKSAGTRKGRFRAEVIYNLVRIFESFESIDVKKSIAQVLLKVAMQSRVFSSESLDTLMRISCSDLDKESRGCAIEVLTRLVGRCETTQEIINVLKSISCDPSLDASSRTLAVKAIGRVFVQDENFSRFAVQSLLEIFRQSDETGKWKASVVLGNISQWKDLPFDSIADLCEIWRDAPFYRKEGIIKAIATCFHKSEDPKETLFTVSEATTSILLNIALKAAEVHLIYEQDFIRKLGQIHYPSTECYSNAIQTLTKIATGSFDEYVKGASILALGEISNHNQSDLRNIVEFLTGIFQQPRNSKTIAIAAASAIGEVAKKQIDILPEVISMLESSAKHFLHLSFAKALANIVQARGVNGLMALEKLEGLIQFFNPPKSIVVILTEIDIDCLIHLVRDTASCGFIRRVCHLTGKAFVIDNGLLKISDNFREVSLICPPRVSVKQLTSSATFGSQQALPSISRSPKISSHSYRQISHALTQFKFDGIVYQRKFETMRNGASALHALLGNLVDSKYYCWTPDSIADADPEEIQKKAKQVFLQSLLPVLTHDHPLKERLRQCMEERLTGTEEFPCLSTQFLDEKSRQKRDQICEKLTRGLYFLYKGYLNSIFSKKESEQMQRLLHHNADISPHFMSCFDAHFDELKQVMAYAIDWHELITLKEEKMMLDEARDHNTRERVSNYFGLYSMIVQEDSYYLSLEELTLAAELLLPVEKRVLLFFSLKEAPRVIHPDGKGETIAIEHSTIYSQEDRYFSRLNCVTSKPSSTTKLPLSKHHSKHKGRR